MASKKEEGTPITKLADVYSGKENEEETPEELADEAELPTEDEPVKASTGKRPSKPKQIDLQEEATDILAQEGIDAQLHELAKATKAKLDKEKKVKVRIPKDQLNKNNNYALVGINGFNLQIMREVNVYLPTPVYELLVQGGYNPIYVP